MKKIYLLLFVIALFIPFYANAKELEKFSYDKANIYFEIDKDVWHYKDFEENKDDVWTSDCGTMTGGIQDIYSGLSEEEKGGFSRNQYNYRNLYSSKEDAEYIAKAWADKYKNELGLDNVEWEIKDFGVVFIYLKGSTGSGENKVSFEQFFTTNNGYGIVLQNMVTSDDSAVCSQSLEDIARTARITDYASNELDALSIVIDLILTIFGYLIYPFVRIVIMKHKYTEKQVKNMILWNSIIVGLIFAIITYSLYGSNTTTNVINFAPALLYYYINCALWVPRFKSKGDNSSVSKKESTKANNENNQSDIRINIQRPKEYKDFLDRNVKREGTGTTLKDLKKNNEEEQFVCDNCGNLVNASATKCPNCGELFEDNSETKNKDDTNNKENSKKKNDKESKSDIDQKYSDLNKLKKLLDKKIITKEEFEKEKKKILK